MAIFGRKNSAKNDNARKNGQAAGITDLSADEARRLFDAESAAQAIYGNGAEETESAEGTLDQPAAAQEVHGLGLHGYGTGGQYVDAAQEDGKSFEEALVQGERMAIADKNYVSGLPLPLWEIPEFRTTKGREALAHEFAEESPELEKCLLTLWNKGIETMACCSGHSARPRYEYDNSPYITLKLTERASVDSLANLIADYNNEYGDAIDVSHVSLDIDPTSKAFVVGFYDVYVREHRLDMSRREYDEQRNRFFAELNERFQSLELGSEQEQEMDQQEYIAEVVDRVTMQSKQSLIVTSTKVSFEPQINVGCCVFDRRLNPQLFSTEVQDALKEMAIFNEGREFELDKETLQVKNNPSLLRYQMENFGSYFGAAEQEQFAEISPRANARSTAEPTYAPEYQNYTESESPFLEPEQPTYAPEYPDGLLRYAPGGSDVTYFYIPCADNNSRTPYLQVMQKDGKAFINIRGVTGHPGEFETETYQILKVDNGSGNLRLKVLKSTADGKAQQGILNLPYASKADPQMEEFLQAIVQNDEQFLEANQNFVRIPPETRNLGDFQVGFTATQQKIEVPVESSDAEAETEADAADAFANVSARVSGARGQTLETKERFSVLGQEFDHATQSIDFAKNLNMSAPQKISVISSTDKNGAESDLLISVTTEGSSRPLAVFREIEGRDDVVSLEIEPRLWDSLQKSNPNLRLPEVEYDHLTNNGYARFEIKKLTFSQTKGLETGEVNGANEDFALSFSALGVLIKDTVRNQGASRTSGGGMPNNIAISEKCIEKMLGNSPVCSIDSTEPTYSQVLVSLNELNRSRTSVTRAAEPLKLQLGLKETSLGKSSRSLTDDDYQVVMHSVPFAFSMPKGLRRTENLNIIQSQDKNGNVQTQVYMQLKNPQTNRVQRPKAYILVGASVEKIANSNEYVLYMSLRDGNKPPINVQLDRLLITPDTAQSASTRANIASLKYLKSIAPEAFEQAARDALSRAHVGALSAEELARDEADFSEELFNGFSDADPARNIDVYPAAANRAEMEINSFNVVSSMQIAEVSAAELAAQPQTETVWQDVIREQPVEQIPDPERPRNRPIYEFEQENFVEPAVQPEAVAETQPMISEEEELSEQNSSKQEPEPQQQILQEEVSQEPEHSDETEFPAEEELEDDLFAVPERTLHEVPEAETVETETKDEMTDEEAEREALAMLSGSQDGQAQKNPGENVHNSLDPNAAGALSPDAANRDMKNFQGAPATESEEAKKHIVTPPETAESKAEELFKPKEKKLLNIKPPNKDAINTMIGLGLLATFLAYFTAGIGAIILTLGAFAIFGAAVLYGAVKVQNIIKEAINNHREKVNAKEREKVLGKIREMDKEDTHEHSVDYLRTRLADRNRQIEQVKADPTLTEEQKQQKIKQINTDYEKFEKELPEARKRESAALDESVKKSPEHGGAKTALEAISHHSAVLKELTDAKGKIVEANSKLNDEMKTMQRLEADRDKKVDQYRAAVQNAEKAEQIASEAADRTGEMRFLLDKSETKKLSKKEKAKLEEDVEFFRKQTNQMNARNAGPKTSFSERDYGHRTPQQLMQDANNVNGDLVKRKGNAIDAELDAQKAKRAAQEKLEAARASVGKAAVTVETAEKFAQQKLYENGFGRKADLDKTIQSEFGALETLTATRDAIKAPVSKPAEKKEPTEKKTPAAEKPAVQRHAEKPAAQRQAEKPATRKETEKTRVTPVASGPSEADLEKERKAKEQKELDQELANFKHARLLNNKHRTSRREESSRVESGFEPYALDDGQKPAGSQPQVERKPATPAATNQPSKGAAAKQNGRER